MAKTREEARQILLSSNLSADEKATLTAVMDAWPDEKAIVAETLKPLATLAEQLGEDGKLLGEAITKGEPAALAAGVKTLLDRQKLLADDNKSMRDRLAAVEGEQKESAWRIFLSANRAKITPAEEELVHSQFLSQRDWTEKFIAAKAPVVLTESVKTAGGAAPVDGREALILDSRRQLREDVAGGQLVLCTEKEAIEGLLVANRQKPLTDDEVRKYQLQTA